MTLFNRKFIEFSFTPNIVTNLNKEFVTIYYLSSWKDFFKGRKKITFELYKDKNYILKFFNNSIIINPDDTICVQVFNYVDDLYIIVNKPIDSEHIDTDKFKDTFADIFVKSNFKFFSWLKIKTNCESIRTNYI